MGTEMFESPEAFLDCLQIIDSFFPTGAYAYSSGLETYAQAGIIRDRASVVELLASFLKFSIIPMDCVIIRELSWAEDKNLLQRAQYFDQLIQAAKAPKELRESSHAVGRSFLKICCELFEYPIVQEYSNMVEKRECYGHYPVGFSLVARAIGLSPQVAILAYINNWTVNMVSCCIRLGILGQIDGQRIIRDMRNHYVPLVESSLPENVQKEPCSFVPALSIRQMQHERLYSRIFKS